MPRSGNGRRLLVPAAACLLLAACASSSPQEVEELLAHGLMAARTRHEAHMDPEAAVLINAVAAVDDGYPGVRELAQELDSAKRGVVNRGLLGMNRTLRPPIARPLWARALLWPADRVLDLADVASVGIHLGLGVFADAHATRGAQVMVGFRSTGGVGLHDYRSLGFKSQSESGVALVAAGAAVHTRFLLGTSGVRGASERLAGLHRPSHPLYQEVQDYWAIGASLTAGIVGAEIDFHPLQLADFFAGLVGVDFLNDDLGRTRTLTLYPVEDEILRSLSRLGSSKRALTAYRRARDSGGLKRSHRADAVAPGTISPDPSRSER